MVSLENTMVGHYQQVVKVNWYSRDLKFWRLEVYEEAIEDKKLEDLKFEDKQQEIWKQEAIKDKEANEEPRRSS